MFEELGKLAARGDIATVSSSCQTSISPPLNETTSSSQIRQTEHMISEKLHGDGMDGVLARKVHEAGPLASFLSGLATKHEVEAMRKVIVILLADPRQRN